MNGYKFLFKMITYILNVAIFLESNQITFKGEIYMFDRAMKENYFVINHYLCHQSNKPSDYLRLNNYMMYQYRRLFDY